MAAERESSLILHALIGPSNVPGGARGALYTSTWQAMEEVIDKQWEGGRAMEKVKDQRRRWKGDGGARSRYIADYKATMHFTDTEGSYEDPVMRVGNVGNLDIIHAKGDLNLLARFECR